MITASLTQELYLLERYTSVEYFSNLENAWRKFVQHNEDCLDRYMRQLPTDLRNKPLPQQADVVWGGHVLPNFRRTLDLLQSAKQLLQSGDLKALGAAWGPKNDFKGQVDFDNDWMTSDDLKSYSDS